MIHVQLKTFNNFYLNTHKYRAPHINSMTNIKLPKSSAKLLEINKDNKKTLRKVLFEYYHKINQELFEFNIVSCDIIEILTIANKSYISRESNYSLGSGLYYKSDYSKYIRTIGDNIYLPPNPKYWESNTAYNIFAIKDNVLPSDAIRAWFNGPTIAECANTIQASIYLSILNIFGDEKFNKRFSNPISQFILTNNLFAPLVKESKKISNTGGTLGNPLFFLFELISPENTNLENIKHGDIVYIKGVKNYNNKHLDGESGGWNLICIKKDREPLKFLGFGPDGFAKGPLSLQELKKLFIDNYNKEHTPIEKARIEKFTCSDYTGEYRSLAETAKKLALDTIPQDSDIIGLTAILRLNKDLLNGFMLNSNLSWEDQELKIVKPLITTKSRLVNIIPFSAENKNKTFDNYKTDTKQQIEILELARKFALHVSSKDNTFPSGFILTGTAGIGKTHLAISIAKYVSTYKRVLYVDSFYFSKEYQVKMSHSSIITDIIDLKNIFNNDKILTDIDMIILDDINNTYGACSSFLESVIKKTYEHKLSILITSNMPIERLYEYMPHYIDIFELFSANFIVKNYKMNSFREPWCKNCVGITEYNTFLDWDGPSGFIILDDKTPVIFSSNFNLSLDSIIQTNDLINTRLIQYASHIKSDVSIKVITPAYKYTYEDNYLKYKINDKYSTGLENAKIAIMYISKHYEGSCDKLIDIIPIIHDNAVKIIIMTDDIIFLKDKLKILIEARETDKQRITDRVRIILPGVL